MVLGEFDTLKSGKLCRYVGNQNSTVVTNTMEPMHFLNLVSFKMVTHILQNHLDFPAELPVYPWIF